MILLLCNVRPWVFAQAIHREVIFWSVVQRLGATAAFGEVQKQVEMIQVFASQRICSTCFCRCSYFPYIFLILRSIKICHMEEMASPLLVPFCLRTGKSLFGRNRWGNSTCAGVDQLPFARG